jgi:FkbM family methyltransferase
MTNDYQLKLGLKTRILNQFRRLLKWPYLEKFIVEKTNDRPTNSFWVRLMPPNYLYNKESMRKVTRRGVNYSLDISDTMEHGVYFGYRDDAQEELFRLAENKKVLIDVGVNIGSVLLNFARICPGASVTGFEPDKTNFGKALGNIELNNYSNIEIVNKGLGESESKVKLYKVNDGNAGMNRILPETASGYGDSFDFDEIDIITLNDFVNERNLMGVDLIKIDVEGYEFHVLRGADQVLNAFKPTLFIELDDGNLRAQNFSAKALVQFLEQLNIYNIRRAGDKKPVKSVDDFEGCHFDIICEPFEITA